VTRLAVTRLRPDAVLPTRAYPGDAGLDLSACDAVVIAPGERVVVGTGVAVAIPPGHAGLVVPRSGLAAKHGLSVVNGPGLIDEGYRGELKVILLNTDREHAVQIAAGDRVAQLIVVAVAGLDAVEVGSLDAAERGVGGLGSSGR
jgi:dUTP pyrophosphatase